MMNLSMKIMIFLVSSITVITGQSKTNLDRENVGFMMISSTDELDTVPDMNSSRVNINENCQLSYSFKVSTMDVTVCAEMDKQFLIYKSYDELEILSSWTYHGLDGPKEWHKIDPKMFNTEYPDISPSMKKKFPLPGQTTESTASGDSLEAIFVAVPDTTGEKKEAPSADPDHVTNGEEESNEQGEEEESSPTSKDKKADNKFLVYGTVPSFIRLAGHLEENFCDGTMPSPINIDKKKAKISDALQEFEYTNMDVLHSVKMYFPEDGTNLLMVRLADDEAWGLQGAPCISKGSITSGKDLCFDRLFIRYGTDHEHGSEHQIDKKSFAMELQFFFTLHDTDRRSMSDFFYVRLTEYLKKGEEDHDKKKGKLVRALSVFVVVDENATTEPNLKLLADMARIYWNSDSDKKIRSFQTKERVFKLRPFFPQSIYYAYTGSLSFPPCFPDLNWNIFETPLKISPQDFEAFLFIPSEFDGTGYVAGNLRPLSSIYVQMENPQINKDEASRKAVKHLRENRLVLKNSLSDKRKSDVYDYYEDDYGIRISCWSVSYYLTISIFTMIY